MNRSDLGFSITTRSVTLPVYKSKYVLRRGENYHDGKSFPSKFVFESRCRSRVTRSRIIIPTNNFDHDPSTYIGAWNIIRGFGFESVVSPAIPMIFVQKDGTVKGQQLDSSRSGKKCGIYADYFAGSNACTYDSCPEDLQSIVYR